METERRLVFARVGGVGGVRENGDWLLNERGVSFGDEKNILELDKNVIVQPCEGTKCHWIVHFETVKLALCEFYLNKKRKRKRERMRKEVKIPGSIWIWSTDVLQIYSCHSLPVFNILMISLNIRSCPRREGLLIISFSQRKKELMGNSLIVSLSLCHFVFCRVDPEFLSGEEGPRSRDKVTLRLGVVSAQGNEPGRNEVLWRSKYSLCLATWEDGFVASNEY